MDRIVQLSVRWNYSCEVGGALYGLGESGALYLLDDKGDVATNYGGKWRKVADCPAKEEEKG